MHTTLPYERLSSHSLYQSFGMTDDEFLLNRSAFRWMKNGEVHSNAYESMELEQICEDFDYEIVETYGPHIAICKRK